ncbi:MAG TPA: hypothetical protein ENK31_01540 [Nannocystis exedens]|nr:hypothetical protein [Nannocystis exedens]
MLWGKLRRSSGIAGLLAVLGPLMACDTPVVEARAVWLDGVHVGGARTIHIYTRGEIETATLSPSSGDQDPDGVRLVLDLAPRGAGALVMAADPKSLQATRDSIRIAYLDFEGRRALPIDLPTGLRAPSPAFSARGDALIWIDPCTDKLALLALGAGIVPSQVVDDQRILVPWTGSLGGAADCQWNHATASAADAPVVFTVALEDGDLGLVPVPGGEVRAFRYADSADAQAPVVELGRGGLLADLVGGRPRGCIDPLHCSALVDPDGESVSVVGGVDEPCRIQRWSWLPVEGEEGEEGEEQPAATICAYSGVGDAVAAISSRHYVVLRDDEVVRVDWTRGEEVALPLFGGAPWSWQLDREGRALIMISTSGPMMRISEGAVEIVNIVQTFCTLTQKPVISPSGRWAAWSCLDGFNQEMSGDGGEAESEGASLGSVIRVSVAGLERYDGVPMWAMAIDDGGSLLLYSRADVELNDSLLPTTSPRNLYVLSGEGELSRVDTLEPDPEPSRGPLGELQWLVAAPL